MKKIIIAIAFLGCVLGAHSQHVLFREWGFYGTASYTMLTNMNRSDYKVLMNGVSLTGGFEIRRQTCVELGFAFLADGNSVFTQMPITIGLRTHYLDTRLTPFTELYAGYSVPLKHTGVNSNGDMMTLKEGGVSAGVNLGARYSFAKAFALNIYVGWQVLMTNEYTVFDAEKLPKLEDSWQMHNFRFGLGVMF